MTVSWWARLLACAFLAASVLAAWGVGREWLQTGQFSASLPGAATSLLFGYIFVVFAWVAVTGKVPGFFSFGAQRWPFRPHAPNSSSKPTPLRGPLDSCVSPATGVQGTMEQEARRPIVLRPGEGRPYRMGGMSAVFKADGAETESRYSVSEWWLEPNTTGPGAHSHPEDDVFYVLEGTMSFLVEGEWVACPQGSFVLVPAGSTHDFENRSPARAGALNISAPGGFEQNMAMIVEWFSRNPSGRPVG